MINTYFNTLHAEGDEVDPLVLQALLGNPHTIYSLGICFPQRCSLGKFLCRVLGLILSLSCTAQLAAIEFARRNLTCSARLLSDKYKVYNGQIW